MYIPFAVGEKGIENVVPVRRTRYVACRRQRLVSGRGAGNTPFSMLYLRPGMACTGTSPATQACLWAAMQQVQAVEAPEQMQIHLFHACSSLIGFGNVIVCAAKLMRL